MKHKKISLVLGSLALTLGVFAYTSSKKAQEEGLVTFATYTNGDGATYYNGISDSLSGNSLLTALRTLNLNKRQSTVGYSSMGTTPSGQFKYTDYDPDYVQYDSNGQPYGTRISSFYTYTSATNWNREHVWPNSHGGGSGGDAGSPYPDADIHMPRPTISSENSSRGNSFFVEGMNHSSNGWDPKTAGYSEQSRGEAARITFYTTLVNSKLILAPNNTTPSGTDSVTGQSFGSGHTMGNLETLIKWNINYPVTQREKNRNEGAEYLQGNRNAFVDHPEYACRIWGNVNSTIKSMCQNASWDTGTGVSISRETASVAVDGTITLIATSTDNSTITWTSSNTSVATVASSTSNSGANMVITGKSAGTATITAKATINSNNYTATCTVTVTSSGGQTDPGDYTKVTSNSQLSNGDKVVLTVDREREELIGVTGWNGNNDATVSVTESEWCQYTVSSASSSGFKLTDPSTSTYIASPTGNHFKYDSSGGTVSAASDGKFVCNSRYLCKNGTYYRCYTSVGSYIPFYIYKVNASSTAKTLSSISLSDKTTEYDVGEEFVKPTVTANYSDGTHADVTSSATCTGYNMNTAGNYTVTVSYTESGTTKTATYSISVVEPVKTLVSISVSNQTTSFILNSNFNFGGTVTASFDNGDTLNVTNSATYSGYDMSTVGNQIVTVSYTYSGVTKTATYQITVSESGQAGTFTGDYNYGNQGSTWSLSDCSDNNTFWLCPSSGSESVALIPGIFTGKTITSNVIITINSATYGSGTAPTSSTFSVYNSEACSTLVSSTQSGTLPTDKNYTDAIYTVSLAEATSKFSSDLAIKIVKPGRQIRLKSITVTFSYTSGGSVTPTLSSITLDTSSVQKSFNVNDTFNYSGLVVTAHYSDSSTQTITTGYTVSSPDMSTAGSKTITVTYSGKTATYTITVNSSTPQPTSDYSLTVGSPYMNGVPYKMYFYSTNKSKNYYFTGAMGTGNQQYYGTSSETKSSGVDVYFEQSGNGQNIYFSDNGTIKYFSVAVSGTHYNFSFSTTEPSTKWIYDGTTNNCLTYSISGTMYTFGNSGTYTSFSAYSLTTYPNSYKVQFETTDHEGAIPFATIMNDYITCNNAGTSAPTFTTGFNWTSFENVYANLDSGSKNALKSTSPSNAEVAEYVARYDYIVGKYGTSAYSDFIGRNPAPIGNHRISFFINQLTSEKSTMILIIIASVLALSTLAGYFFIRRKQK